MPNQNWKPIKYKKRLGNSVSYQSKTPIVSCIEDFEVVSKIFNISMTFISLYNNAKNNS
jgi:hypothetical protein